MNLSVHPSIVLIDSIDKENNKDFGTGFIIHRDDYGTYILTCKHVLRDAGGAGKVRVSSIADVDIEDYDESFDLLVLRVNGLFTEQIFSLCASGNEGKEFVTAGFYRFDGDENPRIKDIKGELGKLEAIKSRETGNRITAWDLKIADGGFLKPGYSGSPVIDENGYVLGVVSHLRGKGEQGSAISIKSLKKIWRRMPSDLIKPTWLYDKILEGHSGCINNVSFSPIDDKILFSCSDDMTIRKWDIATRSSSIIGKHSTKVRAIIPSPNGKVITSGSENGTIRVWDTVTGAKVYSSPSKIHQKRINTLAISPDNKFLISGSSDQTIKVWDIQSLENGSPITDLPSKHTNGIRSIVVSKDGNFFISGSSDNLIKVINFNGKTLRKFIHSDKVLSIAISSDQRNLIIGSSDKTIRIWDLETAQLIDTLTGHRDEVRSVTISPNNQTFASGSTDGTIRIWDLENKKLLHVLPHEGAIRSVAYSPSGKVIAGGSSNASIKLWKLSE
ncbi:MAG: trypsin-like serine protease [Cyanobacteria bacterium RM1_2_2]|nr:trypsin-like serine protease [Cyanobacteria bacterium RM1_2_2]